MRALPGLDVPSAAIDSTKASRTRAKAFSAVPCAKGAGDCEPDASAGSAFSAEKRERESVKDSHWPSRSAKGCLDSAGSATARSARSRTSLEALERVRGNSGAIPTIAAPTGEKRRKATTKRRPGQRSSPAGTVLETLAGAPYPPEPGGAAASRTGFTAAATRIHPCRGVRQ